MKEIKGFKSIRESFGTRQVRYGGYAALITLAVIVGLILINLIVGQFSPQIDMTKYGLYSLTEQTVQVIEQVKAPVNFYGLWRPGEEIPDLAEVIDLYTTKNRNIRFEVVDPNRNPGLVSKFDRANTGIPSGSLVVEGEKGFKIITPQDMYEYMYNEQTQGRSIVGLSMERKITAALLFVATGQTPVIYEVTGHQEILLAELGLNVLVERENFALRQLNLVQASIPEDASIVLLHAPQSDLSQGEADKLLAYLEKGGRFMVLADQSVMELTNLNQVLGSYGMRFDYGFVVENDYYYTGGASYLGFPDLLEHDITIPLLQSRSSVLVVNGMGISELDAKRRTIELKPLLVSSRNSFLRTYVEDAESESLDTDIPGPIITGMTAIDPNWIQGNDPQARIVAIGSGALALYYQWNPANLDMFMNSIAWLEDRPETLSVRSKSMYLWPMRINGFQMVLYAIIIVIVIPLGFFITGLVIWLKRRHL